MKRVEGVRKDIKKLYYENKDEMISAWFYDKHVAVVARYAEEISQETKADTEISVLAALLHDIARVYGIRDDPELTNESLSKTESIMKKYKYSDKQIKQVKSAIIFHGCKDELPRTKEGNILATSDALAHLMTDFYIILPFKPMKKAKNPEEYKKWVLGKIERDFNKKIRLPKYKKLAKKRYEALKTVFNS